MRSTNETQTLSPYTCRSKSNRCTSRSVRIPSTVGRVPRLATPGHGSGCQAFDPNREDPTQSRFMVYRKIQRGKTPLPAETLPVNDPARKGIGAAEEFRGESLSRPSANSFRTRVLLTRSPLRSRVLGPCQVETDQQSAMSASRVKSPRRSLPKRKSSPIRR